MREIRTSSSEGGGIEANRCFLPLYLLMALYFESGGKVSGSLGRQPSALTSHILSESNSLMVMGAADSKNSPLILTKAAYRGWRSAL